MSEKIDGPQEGVENTAKLKMLVQSLKKKYGESVGHAYTLDAKCRELSTENSTLKQTQNALSQKFNEVLLELHSLQEDQKKLTREHAHYSSRASDSEHEVKALREQHQQLLQMLHLHEDEAKKATDELQAVKLKETQLERVIQFLRKRSEEGQLEMNQLTQELSHAQEQHQILSDELAKSLRQVQTLKDEMASKEATHQEEKDELIALTEQLKHLSSAFKEKSDEAEIVGKSLSDIQKELFDQKERYETLSKEHAFLKQSMMRSVEEIKEELLAKESVHQKEIELLKEREKAEKERYEDEIKALSAQIEKYKLQEEETQEARAMKETFLKERHELNHQMDELRSNHNALMADKSEVEQRFKTAQQHLAKKVRETALAQERIEGEKIKSLDLQNQLNHAQIKISELKNSLDMEIEHQKRAMARETELLKNSEREAEELEKRYFQTYEQLKAAETEIRELKRVEEKWREAEKLFSNMAHFSAGASNFQIIQPSDVTSKMIDASLQPIHTPLPAHSAPLEKKVIKKEQTSLFEETKMANPFKESFL